MVTESDGKRYPLTVLDFQRDKNKVHPTQKPVALMEYLIRTYTNEGDTVLDNCMGSGTTGVACANTNRVFIGIEQDPKYFQIAKSRIDEALAERGSGSITHRRFSARRGDARRCVVTPGRARQGKEKSNNAEKKE